MNTLVAFIALWCGKYAVAQTLLSTLPGAYRWGGVTTDSALGKYVIAAQTSVSTKTTFDGRIYYSSNYGRTFNASNAPAQGYLNMASSLDNRVAIAVSNSAVYVTQDYGVHWSNATSEFPAIQVASDSTGTYLVTMSSGQTNCLRVSANSGVSWSGTFGPSVFGSSCTAVGIDGKGATILLGMSGLGLYFSTRSGTNSWSTPKLSYPSVASFGTIAFGGNTFYAGQTSNPYYIMRTTNYGSTWAIAGASKAYATLSGSMTLSDMKVDNSTGQRFLAIIGGDLFYSTNRGDSMTQLTIDVYMDVCTMTNNGTNGYWNENPQPFTYLYTGNPATLPSVYVDPSTYDGSGGGGGLGTLIIIIIVIVVLICLCLVIIALAMLCCKAAFLAALCYFCVYQSTKPSQPLASMQQYPPTAPVYAQTAEPVPAATVYGRPVVMQQQQPVAYGQPIYAQPMAADPKMVSVSLV